MRIFARIVRDKAGATAIEYGLIIALVALGIVSAVQGIGEQVSDTFSTTSSSMTVA